MAERITDKNVRNFFPIFAKAMGKRVAKAYNDVGAWRLDHDGMYGYAIEEISNVGGGVSMPFGYTRRKASEMWYAMRFALDALAARKRRTRTALADRRRRRTR